MDKIMKKIIIYLISIAFIFSMTLPFIGQMTTQAKMKNQLKLSNNDEESMEVLKSDEEQRIELTVTNSTENKVELQLLEGLTYKENLAEVSFDKDNHKLEVQTNKEQIKIPLYLNTEKLETEKIVLNALIDEHEKLIKSNDFNINIVSGKVERKNTEVVPSNDSKSLKITNEEVQKSEVTANNKTVNMTTKEDVPNAPVPEKITKANPEAANEVDVTSWTEFEAAMKNKAITVIHVQKDFYNDRTTVAETNVSTPKRTLTIKGNGHIIDFRGIGFRNGTAAAANETILWTIENLTMYGRNFYGPIHTIVGVNSNNSYGGLIYKDSTYVGAQLTASYYWTIDFGGAIENHSVNSYISPFDEKKYATQTGQVNIEATDVIFRKNSKYNGTTENAGVFRLQNSGEMTMEDYSEVTMTSGGTAGEYSGNVLYLQGVIKTGKEAVLNLNTRKSGGQSAIEIYGAKNGIQAAEGSKINIHTTGGNGTHHAVSMGADTEINIEDGAELNINAENKSSGTGDLINAGARTKFLIGKKAKFNAVSDGTGSHNILDFGTNSKFQFADAEEVNLQYTNNSLASGARLITMSGSNGQLDVDVQDVKAWNKKDIAGNSMRESDFHWTPMFGMITQFSTGTSTVKNGSSVLNSMREKYKNEFKVHESSRLLYSYIEDVDVGILNPITDNQDSVDSTVIHGVANPGAYVRLTGDSAIPEPTIPSVIDGADDEELTNNFTVIADSKGEFTIHAKEGKHFTASNKIKAFAFLGGKSDEHIVEVLDETAPTGEGVNLKMVFGEAIPEPDHFIINPLDSNPANAGFKYEFKEDYSKLIEEEGKHTLVILLFDTAGNKTEIPVELEVTKDGYGIKADNFTINLSDLKKYDTTEELHKMLLKESKAVAFGIVENETIDLTEFLNVEDFEGINEMKAGKYRITLSFDLTATEPGAVAKKKFTVSVLNNESVNPTNPEKPGKEKPEETENEGTGETGLLKLDYAPSNFDFDKVKMGYKSVKVNAVKTTSDKQWLQVSDDRLDENITNWSIQVSQEQQMTSNTGEVLKGAEIKIPAGKLYNEETGEVEVTTGQLTSSEINVTTTPKTIFSANNNSKKMNKISTNVWNAKDVTLTIPGGQAIEFDEYSNSICWSLVIEP